MKTKLDRFNLLKLFLLPDYELLVLSETRNLYERVISLAFDYEPCFVFVKTESEDYQCWFSMGWDYEENRIYMETLNHDELILKIQPNCKRVFIDDLLMKETPLSCD